MPTVLTYDPEELTFDGDWRADDIAWALDRISWDRPMVTVRIDKDVAKFLADALRPHAARAHR
jgi:hypothetical protein